MPKERLNSLLFAALALSILFSLPDAPSCAEPYHWVDGKGVTHLTNTPPPEDNPGAKKSDFSTNILITESMSSIEKWVRSPGDERDNSGRIRKVRVGKRYFLPFVVTGYAVDPSQRINLTASFTLTGPDGVTLLDNKKAAFANFQDPRSPGVIVLEPVIDIHFDPTDSAGHYIVRVSITDHVKSMTSEAEEDFDLVK